MSTWMCESVTPMGPDLSMESGLHASLQAMLTILALLAAVEGRPLFYWGARPAVVTVVHWTSSLVRPAEKSSSRVMTSLKPPTS